MGNESEVDNGFNPRSKTEITSPGERAAGH